MQLMDDDIRVESAGEEPFTATTRAKKREKKQERIRSRIWELDFLRGLSVILMIWDHLMFDIGFVFGENHIRSVSASRRQEMF